MRVRRVLLAGILGTATFATVPAFAAPLWQDHDRDRDWNRNHDRDDDHRNRRDDDRRHDNGNHNGWYKDRDHDRGNHYGWYKDRGNGYYGNGYRDDSWHSYNGGNRGYYPYYGGNGYYGGNRGGLGQAQSIGYQDGVRDGQNDRATGHSFRPTHDDSYHNADRGYSSAFGDKQTYKNTYRQGYEQGYQRGYNANGGRW
jgi:hypothetical protein